MVQPAVQDMAGAPAMFPMLQLDRRLLQNRQHRRRTGFIRMVER